MCRPPPQVRARCFVTSGRRCAGTEGARPTRGPAPGQPRGWTSSRRPDARGEAVGAWESERGPDIPCSTFSPAARTLTPGPRGHPYGNVDSTAATSRGTQTRGRPRRMRLLSAVSTAPKRDPTTAHAPGCPGKVCATT